MTPSENPENNRLLTAHFHVSKYRYFGTLETLRNRGFNIVFRGVFGTESDPKRCKTGVNKNEHDFGPFFIETLYCIHARARAGFAVLEILTCYTRNSFIENSLATKIRSDTMGFALFDPSGRTQVFQSSESNEL